MALNYVFIRRQVPVRRLPASILADGAGVLSSDPAETPHGTYHGALNAPNMPTPPAYPKGDLRRMLCVLAAIDALGDEATLVRVSARSGVDKKTVATIIRAAGRQAGVSIGIRTAAGIKNGVAYRIESWGPVFKKKGAYMALQGALNAPIIDDIEHG